MAKNKATLETLHLRVSNLLGEFYGVRKIAEKIEHEVSNLRVELSVLVSSGEASSKDKKEVTADLNQLEDMANKILTVIGKR